MLNIIKQIRNSKDEYRKQMARVDSLPDDYQFVYRKINDYIWGFAGGMGTDMLKTQYDLIDLFEESAAQGKHVLDVTGDDVALFCDQLICDNLLWTDKLRKRLNYKINKKLGG